MNVEQLQIAEDFTNMIETEYQLCVREIIRTGQAITKASETEADEYRNNLANREIDSLHSYWQRRLYCLIELLETKDRKLSEELKRKYESDFAVKQIG
ncbi:MAG: hypothetical protein F6K36_22835 [Symploca sp. SIO3C6]|nr:hypothetical protein [Symploca sp. SIO3C6]NET08361.1 hypothetical protein [Symploca sp. SIO2B6]